jgi:NitT/TauT family transport system permease protein
VAQPFCSGESRTWIDLILPSALPYVVTGLRLPIGRALIGVIVAEFCTAFAGPRNLIVTNANSFRTDRTFVPILLVALLGITLTRCRNGPSAKSCGGQQRTDPCDDP